MSKTFSTDTPFANREMRAGDPKLPGWFLAGLLGIIIGSQVGLYTLVYLSTRIVLKEVRELKVEKP